MIKGWKTSMSTALARIDRQKARLEAMLASLNERRILAIRDQDWVCRARKCGQSSLLSSVVLVRTHWYTPPHGCSGGDYWTAGERNLICPKCSVRHRMIAQDPQPPDYYDYSHEKQRKIDAARKVVMEREYQISAGIDFRQIFDNIIDAYKDAYYEIRRAGKDVKRDRPARLSDAEAASLYGLSPLSFSTFINV
jgi:hypothetical protein